MCKNFVDKLKKWHILKDLGCIFVSHMPKFFVKKSDTFDFILITYFNWGNNPLAISEEYLDKRFKIFDKYTFPSVNAQTDKDFTWFILLNDKTPQKYKDIFCEYTQKASMIFMPVYVDNFDDSIGESGNLNIALKKYYPVTSSKWRLTCRFDNDDMLAKNYVEKMKENFRPVNNMFINFDNGFNLDLQTNALNNYEHNSSHFIGYVEKSKSLEIMKTAYHFQHSICKSYGFVRRIRDNKPIWCEICHDTNRLNYFRGTSASDSDMEYFKEYFVTKNQ